MKKLLLFFLVICNLFITTNFSSLVYAEEENFTSEITTVLEDLEKDKSFNKLDYIEDQKDLSVSIITIAENENNELYLYVYQPNINTLCSSVNISIGDLNFSLPINNYKVELINNDGVFFKYKVLLGDLGKISTSNTRYYDIISLFRYYDETLDTKADWDNTVTEIAYNVGRKYYVNLVDNNKYYSWQKINTVEIKDKLCGSFRYIQDYNVDWLSAIFLNYFGGYNGSFLDTYYIAFNTDVKIDNLLEVEIIFKTQQYVYSCDTLSGHNVKIDWGEEFDKRVVVVPKEKHTNSQKFFLENFSWNTIQSGKEFVDGFVGKKYVNFGFEPFTIAYGITDEGRAELESKNYVVHFYEFVGALSKNLFRYEILEENVTDVSILRLKYQTNGELFDLGVVDTKQSGKGTPGLTTEIGDSTKFIIIIVLIILVVVFIILSIYCPVVLNAIFSFIKTILVALGKGVVWVYNGIVTLFKKIFKKE